MPLAPSIEKLHRPLSRLEAWLRSLRPWSAAWLLVCAIPAIVLASLFGSMHWVAYTRLLLSGVHGRGVVSAVHCGRHAAIEYRFTANGENITASARRAALGEKCTPEMVGRRVDVTFLASDPRTSVPRADIAWLFASDVLLVASLGALGFVGEALVLRAARNRSMPGAPPS